MSDGVKIEIDCFVGVNSLGVPEPGTSATDFDACQSRIEETVVEEGDTLLVPWPARIVIEMTSDERRMLSR